LRKITLLHKEKSAKEEYPFSIPSIQSMTELDLTKRVTFFVGENGSGKSTLLEGIAAAVGSITVAGESIEEGISFEAARKLSKFVKLSWRVRTKRGLFLKAEDFINYIKNIEAIKTEAQLRLEEIEEEYKDKSILAKQSARKPYLSTLGEVERLYDKGLQSKSHGEGYFDLFRSRFIPNGLYILDEPETPLSPMRQLGFISMLKDMVNEGAQFIIVTHSPILMAYPEATIINFDQVPIKEVNFNDLEHVNLTRSFLNNPEQYLRHL